MTIRHIDPRQPHQRHLTCEHCGATPSHQLGIDCERFICGLCVDAALRKNGRPLRFPREEQDEFLLTGAIRCNQLQEATC